LATGSWAVRVNEQSADLIIAEERRPLPKSKIPYTLEILEVLVAKRPVDGRISKI